MGLSLGSFAGGANMMGLSSIASIGGSLYAANKQAQAAKQVNRQTIEANERQLKNQHQWEVADLEAAGLNPLLSANSGAGVANNSQQVPDYSQLGSGAQQVANIIMDSMRIMNENKLTDSQSENLDADTTKKRIESGTIVPVANSIIHKNNSIATVNSARAGTEMQQQRVLAAEVGLAELESKIKKGDIDIQGYTKQQMLQDIERNMKSLRVETIFYENEMQRQLNEAEYLNSKFGTGTWYIKRAWDDAQGPVKSAVGAYMGYKGAQSAKGIGDAIRQTHINNYHLHNHY